MPLTRGGVLRLPSPERSPRRSVVRSAGAVMRLQVPGVEDEPFSELA